jgi:hypothetical protein
MLVETSNAKKENPMGMAEWEEPEGDRKLELYRKPEGLKKP